MDLKDEATTYFMERVLTDEVSISGVDTDGIYAFVAENYPNRMDIANGDEQPTVAIAEAYMVEIECYDAVLERMAEGMCDE